MNNIIHLSTMLSCLLAYSMNLFAANINTGNEAKELQRYRTERQAALNGASWYDKKYVPSAEEVQYVHNLERLTQIKVRLPIDLQRIITEHVQKNKPVSIAVACGDRELPWRTQFARQQNDQSRPNNDDFWEHFAQDTIDHSNNNDNFISIDPLLGIEEEDMLIPSSGRGAGHIIMDARNPNHWMQLFDFLDEQKVMVSRVINTAMLSADEIFVKDSVEAAILDRLKSGSKLVFPYFGSFFKHDSTNFCGSRRWLRWDDNGWQGLFLEGNLSPVFRQDNQELIRMGELARRTHYSKFFTLLEKIQKNEEIKGQLKIMVEKSFADSTADYKDFIQKLAEYYLRDCDITKFGGGEKSNGNSVACFKTSVMEQNKIIWQLFLLCFKDSFKASLLSSPAVVMKFAPSVVQEQGFSLGDYPYGERDNIALVIEKI